MAFGITGTAAAITMATAAPAEVEWTGAGPGPDEVGTVHSERPYHNQAAVPFIGFVASAPIGLAGALIGNKLTGSPVSAGFGAGIGVLAGLAIGSAFAKD